MAKEVTTIRLEPELILLAKARGINLSKLTEIALKKELRNDFCKSCGRMKSDPKYELPPTGDL